ncbi:unnamed protein product [Meganyctiphanes norvegica]|uniref:Uncharacterized protein n=1 Tax=Meganyctiphanes norvegica TaxID=48144 RepID=A0AAV2SBA2_MEGNR
MSQVYLRDLIVPNDYNGQTTKRTIEDLRTILTEIMPTISPITIAEKRLGFLVSYSADTDINHLFKPASISKLREKQMTIRLSYASQLDREILILKTPNIIYIKPTPQLTAEIQQSNKISILHLEKFCSEKSKKNYIKITLFSKQEKINVLNNGVLHIFQECLPVCTKYVNARARSLDDATAPASLTTLVASHRIPSTTPAQEESTSTTTIVHELQLATMSITPSDQEPTVVLPKANNLSGLLTQPCPLPHRQIPSQHDQHVADIKMFLHATIAICDRLNDGVDNPTVFVQAFNDILRHHGHSPVRVPQTVINSSKTIFLRKNDNIKSSLLSQVDPKRHGTTQGQPMSMPTPPWLTSR